MNLIENKTEIKGFSGDFEFLSNMYVLDVPIEFRGKLYKSSENAYQSAKFIDLQLKEDIKNASSKGSKKIANNNKNNIVLNWSVIKLDIMAEVVFKKFLYNLDLREMLLRTGDVYIEETNMWNDCFYGVCNGVGENHLGKILMRTRSYFKINEK
jgi:ribA/ribD-fused uncharacterized protein